MDTSISRRDLLRAGAGLAGGIVLGGLDPGLQSAKAWSAESSSAGDLRVYVIVIDSLRPDEVTADLMPALTALRAEAVWYESVSVLPASSTANLAALLTGALPQDNGFAYQLIADRERQSFQVDHLFTRPRREREGVRTFSFSNTRNDAGENNMFANWGSEERPQKRPHVGGLVPDPFTSFELEALKPGPQFGLLHLGDPDLVAHTLPTPDPGQDPGAAARAERETAIRTVDERLGRFIEKLTAADGAWSRTILFVVSDHGMDFVTQDRWVDFESELLKAGYRSPEQAALPGGDGRQYAPQGQADGSVFIQVTPADDEHIDEVADLFRDMTSVSLTEGVSLVATRTSTPALNDLGLDMKDGLSSDVLAFANDGHTFSPGFVGTHGHPLTQSNALLVSGGHPWFTQRAQEFVGFERPTASTPANPVGRPSVLSLAPTIAWLFEMPQAPYYENGRLPHTFNRS